MRQKTVNITRNKDNQAWYTQSNSVEREQKKKRQTKHTGNVSPKEMVPIWAPFSLGFNTLFANYASKLGMIEKRSCSLQTKGSRGNQDHT